MRVIKITPVILALILIFSVFTPVFATDTSLVLDVENEGNEVIKKNSMFEDSKGLDPGLPEVTVDDAANWIERKGFEIIHLMQKFMQPFAIAVFIASAIMALAGVFGRGQMTSKGLVGMFLALVIYAVGLYAPEIVDVFLSWVSS